ncbi:MAG: hypothetical protein ABSD44_08855 [Terracidiphilus sp.]
MSECAFCPHTGKLSAEHIASAWMRELFPGRRTAWIQNDNMKERKTFETDSIDWTAKVVCENCNNTWMSAIEGKHAKPALTPLITGQMDIPIDRSRAHSMALFAFKTAVVLDHTQRFREPFFSKRIRYAFRQHLAIPNMVNMWFCGIKDHRGNGQFKSAYMKGDASPAEHFLMYVCTCAIGCFVFQVLAVTQIGNARFSPLGGFEGLGEPFFPSIRRGYIWPPRFALDGVSEFEAFADRWRNVVKIGD